MDTDSEWTCRLVQSSKAAEISFIKSQDAACTSSCGSTVSLDITLNTCGVDYCNTLTSCHTQTTATRCLSS